MSIESGTPGRKRIAYFKRGLFSYSNVRTGEQLRRVFPEYEVEEIDIAERFLRRRKGVAVWNFLLTLSLYGGAIARRQQALRLCLIRTPYIFRRIRQWVREEFGPRKSEYAFSFQTQSLFDASIPGLPHFVYTDHAHLTNLSYPGFSRDQLVARDWIDLEQDIYRNANHTFVMSEHVRDSLRDRYQCPPERSSCVYAGSNVDTNPVPLDNDNYGNKTIVFVGVEWERKGGPTLLAAFKRVLEKIPDARLVIVGCQPSVSHPQIQAVGRVSHDEVKAQLARASVLCLPTRVEPFGIAVIEAYYHQLPVVVSRIGAMPHLVKHGETGLLVEPDNSAALAAALVELLSDPAKCAAFGKSGAQFVEGRFSWDAVGDRMSEKIRAEVGNV